MALIPYLLDFDIRPRRSRDRFFDDLDDFILDRPLHRVREYVRPWRNLGNLALRDVVGSTIKSDKDKFQVNLDVQHFAPEEISVKTADGFVVVEGKHEEKQDEHGYISRQFTRRYALPDGCNPDTVESKLSTDGVLTILAPKSSGVKGERSVPITQTGPVRRKAAGEDEQLENGDADMKESDVKSPQKKRRR